MRVEVCELCNQRVDTEKEDYFVTAEAFREQPRKIAHEKCATAKAQGRAVDSNTPFDFRK